MPAHVSCKPGIRAQVVGCVCVCGILEGLLRLLLGSSCNTGAQRTGAFTGFSALCSAVHFLGCLHPLAGPCAQTSIQLPNGSAKRLSACERWGRAGDACLLVGVDVWGKE